MTAPRFDTAGESPVSPGRENRQLAVAAGLGIGLANGCLVRGQFLLDLCALIARCSRQILLGILKFILIEVSCACAILRSSSLPAIAPLPGAGVKLGTLGLITYFGRLLQLCHLSRKLEGFAGRRQMLLVSLAQRRGKGLVYFVIGQSLSVLRELAPSSLLTARGPMLGQFATDAGRRRWSGWRLLAAVLFAL